MAKSIRIFIVLVLAGMRFVSSCSSPGERPFARIDVDHIDAVDSLVAEEALEDYRIVKLETGPNALIGKVHRILFVGDRLFVLDKSIAKNVFVFDGTGKYLYNVGQTGRGPGEYLKPYDIAIDLAKNELILYEEGVRKLFVYDLAGRFKREHGINLFFGAIEYIDEGTILDLSDNAMNTGNDDREYPYDLFVINREGVISKNYLFNGTKKGIGYSVLTKNRCFSRNDDNIFLNYLFKDNHLLSRKGLPPRP